MKRAFLVTLCAGVLSSAGAAQNRISEWPVYGGDQAGSKYSPLTQISRET